MKKTYKKRLDIAVKAILLLCLSVAVFGCLPRREVITVYLGGEDDMGSDLFCPESLIIEDIKLRVKTGSKTDEPGGCMCAKRDGLLIRENAYSLFFTGRPVKRFYLLKEDGLYETTVNPAFLQRFNEILEAFEKSPYSCLYNVYGETL